MLMDEGCGSAGCGADIAPDFGGLRLIRASLVILSPKSSHPCRNVEHFWPLFAPFPGGPNAIGPHDLYPSTDLNCLLLSPISRTSDHGICR
jgi:hypothetical protein